MGLCLNTHRFPATVPFLLFRLFERSAHPLSVLAIWVALFLPLFALHSTNYVTYDNTVITSFLGPFCPLRCYKGHAGHPFCLFPYAIA